MSTPIDDGGPAFPEHHYFDPSRGQYGMHMTASDVGCGGMSLRDWFAGQMLAGEFVQNEYAGHYSNGCPQKILVDRARLFYRMADAMIAARKETEA